MQFVRCLKKPVDPDWWFRKLSDRLSYARSRRILDLLVRLDEGKLSNAASYRRRLLTSILSHAYKHCPYYREAFDSAGFGARNPERFDRLPLLDRTTVKARRSELEADCLRRICHHTKRTGGSTGEPLEFPLASSADYMDHAHYEFTYRLMGYRPGDRIVTFGGRVIPQELRDRGVFWMEAECGTDLPHGSIYYSQLYLTDQNLPLYADQLLQVKPAIIRGHPSFINEIASYFLDNSIKPLFAMKGVQFTAEVAHDWQIENVTRAFGTRVFLQYGHSEAAVFAYTRDDTREYLCSPFFGLTEVLGPDGKHVSPGETGEVVVTGFHNYALPFIRYRTGDLAVYNGEQNGVVRLGRIEGRAQDYLHSADGRRITLTTLVQLQAFRRIHRWQVIQDTPGKATVRIVREAGFGKEDEDEIVGNFRQFYGVDVTVEYTDHIPVTQRGKVQLLVQRISD